MKRAVLPAAWRFSRLAELCESNAPIMYGILQPGPEIDAGIPYVRPTEIDEDGIRLSQIKRTTPEIAARYRRSTLKPGDLLITIVGTLGRIAVVPPELEGANITQSSARIRLAPGVADMRYIRQVLRSPVAVEQYESNKLGTGVPRLNIHHVRDLQIPLPPLAEQRQIAEVLDRAEALRAKRRAALAQLDTLTQSLFLDLFGDPATNPKGWPIGTVSDLLESASYGTSEKAGTSGEFPVLRMNNITRTGKLDLTDLKFMNLPLRLRDRYLVKAGDVLFNRTNSADLVGKTAICRGTEPMAYAGYLVRLRVNSQNDPEYLWAFLNTDYSKRMLRGMCKSIIGMANINATEIQAMKVPEPPLSVQRELAKRIAAVEELKSTHRASLASLDALFASLQHRAFRGEL